MKKDRAIRTLFAVVAVFSVLGLGNIIFGSKKLDYYRSSLSTATTSPAMPDHPEGVESLPPKVNRERQDDYIRRLHARVSFYSLVVIGGKCFLAVSGMALLGIFVRLRLRDDEDYVEQKSEDSDR